MSGSGKGGNNRRRPFRRRERENDTWQEAGGAKKKGEKPRFDKNQGLLYDRPKWSPAKKPTEPLPAPECAWCGKPIRDIAAAVTDKKTGQPVHFDCIIAKIAAIETPDRGDTVTYIGGGRFGIVHFANPQDQRNFTIKKILEWEDKENRADWRKTIADYYSIT
jgi:hypothetical protein